MAAKKQSMDKFTLAAIVLIGLAVLFFIYDFAMGLKAPITAAKNIVADFKVINIDAISTMKSFNVCGNWPYLTVSKSAERGNPFNRKTSAAVQMVATDVVQCQPMTQ